MSNARSPREVCSTTMGTSGLKVLVFFRVVRSGPALPSGAGADANSPGSEGPSLAMVSGRTGVLMAPGGQVLWPDAGPLRGRRRRFGVVARLGRVQQVARPRVLDADRLR